MKLRDQQIADLGGSPRQTWGAPLNVQPERLKDPWDPRLGDDDDWQPAEQPEKSLDVQKRPQEPVAGKQRVDLFVFQIRTLCIGFTIECCTDGQSSASRTRIPDVIADEIEVVNITRKDLKYSPYAVRKEGQQLASFHAIHQVIPSIALNGMPKVSVLDLICRAIDLQKWIDEGSAEGSDPDPSSKSVLLPPVDKAKKEEASETWIRYQGAFLAIQSVFKNYDRAIGFVMNQVLGGHVPGLTPQQYAAQHFLPRPSIRVTYTIDPVPGDHVAADIRIFAKFREQDEQRIQQVVLDDDDQRQFVEELIEYAERDDLATYKRVRRPGIAMNVVPFAQSFKYWNKVFDKVMKEKEETI